MLSIAASFKERFLIEHATESDGIVVGAEKAYDVAAHGTNARIELQRALQRTSGLFRTTQHALENARTLRVQPCREVGLSSVGVRHAR